MQAFTGRSDSPPTTVARAAALPVGRVGQFGDDHRAGAAVALGATLLGAGAVRVLAQPFEHAARGCGAFDGDDAATVHEADRSGVHTGSR